MTGPLSTAVNNPVDAASPSSTDGLASSAERAAQDLWIRAAERLRARLSRHTFQTYFEPIRPLSLIQDELVLAHSSRFMIDWVRDNLLDVLLRDLEEQHGRPCAVEFEVREGEGYAPAEAPQQAPPQPQVARSEAAPPPRPLNINPKYTFDSFVVGPSNQFAVAACTAVANAPGKDRKSVV